MSIRASPSQRSPVRLDTRALIRKQNVSFLLQWVFIGEANMDDMELLQEFADRHSEEAFRTLVERHIDLVYSLAVRRLSDPHAAQEVMQTVFIDLAAKARTLSRKTILAVRFAAAKALRSEHRRQRWEREAAQMEPIIQETKLESQWDGMEPILNEALEALPEKDRCAILLRFFEKKALKEVGAAMGLNEAAAKKRVSRAVERLRVSFQKRGIAVPSAVLLTALSAHTLQAAPAGLASTIAAAAILKGTALSTSTLTIGKGIIKLMALSKFKIAAAGVALLLVGGTTTYVVNQNLFRAAAGDETALRIFQSGSASELDKAPPLVFLRVSKPHAGPEGAATAATANGKMMGKDVSIKTLLSRAYGMNQSRVGGSTALSDQKYDFLVSLPASQPEALQKAIREKLGLTAQKQVREEEVYILKAHPGDFPGLEPSVAKGTSGSVKSGSGRLDFVNGPIALLSNTLENFLGRPILDETGLTGRFDIFVSWDEPDENRPDREGLKKALTEQLGIELVPDKRPLEMLVAQSRTTH
jgi:uncharacterized protein (TIGR03435 family)